MPVDQINPHPAPLVSIGVPVRNGALFLDEAITLLRRQTYTQIEIIVGDNASDDGTAEIIQRHAAEDSRIRAYRHKKVMTAVENFRFVFEKSRGDFFMWAACDDRRSPDNVEKLLSALASHPHASLAFGDVAEFSELRKWEAALPIDYPFVSDSSSTNWSRILRYTKMNCLHIYGMIRRKSLESYAWIEIDNGPDIPLLVHLAMSGSFVRARGGCFFYYVPSLTKSLEQRAQDNSLHRLKPFPEFRLAWACARAANCAARINGGNIPLLSAFIIVYMNRHWRWVKPWLFGLLPTSLIILYRRWFKRATF